MLYGFYVVLAAVKGIVVAVAASVDDVGVEAVAVGSLLFVDFCIFSAQYPVSGRITACVIMHYCWGLLGRIHCSHIVLSNNKTSTSLTYLQ